MHWTDEAIYQIKILKVPHRNYERALSEALSTLVASAPGEVVCITGPSRSGKSRLAGELARLIVGERPTMDEALMPVVTVLASNCTNRGIFRTKDFVIHCLEAIRHPIYGIGRLDDPWDSSRHRLLEKTNEGVLSDAFRQALGNRRTIYLFIDEAQHVKYALGGDWEAAAVLDSWKCMAATARVVLVLIGAYPLVEVLHLAPHILGRKHQIHLPRYYPTPEDLTSFLQILDAYSSLLRLPTAIRSLRHWGELLYSDSFGCIGHVESWIRDALAVARSENADSLTEAHLRKSRKPYEDRRVIGLEIEQGEATLRSDPTEQDYGETIHRDSTPKQRKTKPFRKKLRRYSIGGRL